jgi:uncharacterized membrane protein
MSSADDPQLEVLLACFQGRKRAAKVHHPLSKQIKAEVAEILDEAVLTVTPKGKARVYDPRRVVVGTLTPALTWGAFTLLGGGKGWSLVIWVVIGAVCGGLYAYYYEHLANKNELARLGKQLLPDSSAVLAYVAGATAGKLAAVAANFGPSAASVATIGTDLSATVLGGRMVSPAGVPAATAGSVPADRHTLLTMLLFRYAGSSTAKRVYAQASGKSHGSHPAIETELLLRTDTGGRRHVVSPSAGAWASAKGDIGGWAVFGAAVGLIAGFGGNGGLFGALEKGVVSGIVWGILGLAAGSLYGLWAGRSVSARRLNSIRPILPPDTSMVLAWAEGAPPEQAVTAWSAPGSEQLLLRFESAPHGAVLDV